MRASVDRKLPIVEAGAFLAVLAAALIYVGAHLPAGPDYRFTADEGVYFRQALTLLHEGPRGLQRLADEYVRDAAAQIGPAPIRLGHLVAAAAALAVRPTMRALSVLSLVCYAGLSIVVFVCAAQFWDRRLAALAGIFAAVSPLGWGLATRALMDTDLAFISTVMLFTLLRWLSTGRERHFAVFAVALAWCLLVKETAWMYVPFAAGTILWMKLTGRPGVRLRHLVIVLAVVPASVFLIYVAMFGGVSRVLAVLQMVHRANVSQPNAYFVAYGSGPWYEYIVDFFVLSPLVTLLFLLFCGRTIADEGRDWSMTFVLLFACYVAGVLSLVGKNPRYALPLDPLLRIGAAAMVTAIATASRHRPVVRVTLAATLAGLVVLTDARAFHRYFVAGRIYDPVAANLLSTAGFLPRDAGGSDRLQADTFIALGLEFYKQRDFRAAIRMGEIAVALKPDSAVAFNNLGAAHAELGEWQAAVNALETALRLQPDFPLARNNLAWARSGLPNR